MPRIPVFIYAADPATGNALGSVSCTVKNSITNANVSLFSAVTGGSSVTNPLVTDSLGRAFAWTERVPLKIDYSGAGITPYSEYRGDNSQPTFETSLPAGYDGQEIYFQDSNMATAGVVWHLRYRSAASGSYKWEFIGGGAVYNSSSGNVSLTAVGVNTALTGDLALTVPLAGEYDVNVAASVYHTGTNQGIYIFPTGAGFSGSGNGQGSSYVVQAATTNTAAFAVNGVGRITCTTAGGALNLGYYVGAAGGALTGRRSLSLTPIRVG